MEKNKKLILISPEILILLFLTGVSFYITFANITFPDHKTFDEFYRITRVEQFLKGEPFLSPHPHFGRYLIILGVLLFGDNPMGWRFVQAILGSLLTPLSYLIGKNLFNHKYAGLLVAYLATFEFGFLLYSRLGVAIISQVFFIALSLLLFIKATRTNKSLNLYYFACAICTGLSISIKWTSLFLLPVYFLWIKTNGNIKKFIFSHAALLIAITVFTYILTFIGETENFEYYNKTLHMHNSNFIDGVINWHKLAFNAQANAVPDTYSSKWYTWPLLLSPILISWTYDPISKNLINLVSMGNPVIWWSGILAIIFQLILFCFKKQDGMVSFLIGTYFISFLPYAFISRPMYLYHYLPSLFILILILEYSFISLYKSKKKIFRALLASWVILVFLVFIYFYPIINGYPLSCAEYKNRMWLKCWKEKLLTYPEKFMETNYHVSIEKD